MKSLLKYILPVLFFAVISHSNEGSLSDVSLQDFKTVEESIIAQRITITDSDYGEEFCLPRQFSAANTFRVHGSVKRTTGSHRINSEYIVSGKVINAGLRFFIQKRSIITHSFLANPSCRLLTLGKLII